MGTNVPQEFQKAVENQFHMSCEKGPLTRYPIVNTKYVLQDGQIHSVDSSQNAFSNATRFSISSVFEQDGGCLLEPVMDVEVSVPIDTYVI